MRKATILTTVCMTLAAGSAFAQQAKIGKDAEGKDYLQAPSGMTLYVFDSDGKAGGGSSCYDRCAATWPPFSAGADEKPNGDWTVVKRTDGAQQWAYKGRPLYTYTKDTAPGQRNGNSFNGNQWHVAQP